MFPLRPEIFFSFSAHKATFRPRLNSRMRLNSYWGKMLDNNYQLSFIRISSQFFMINLCAYFRTRKRHEKFCSWSLSNNLLISQIMTNYYSLRITISMNYFIRFYPVTNFSKNCFIDSKLAPRTQPTNSSTENQNTSSTEL